MKKTMIFLAMLMVISFSCKKSLPIAMFTTTKKVVNIYETVICTNESQNAESFIWETHGEIGFDYDFSPSFAIPGTYTIKLTASNGIDSDSFSKTITVVSKKMDNTVLIDGLCYAIQ